MRLLTVMMCLLSATAIAAEKDNTEMYLKGDVIICIGEKGCDPCKRISNVLKNTKIIAEYADRIRIVHLDVSDLGELVETWSIDTFPTMIFLHDGAPKLKHVGGWMTDKETEAGLRKLIDDYLPKEFKQEVQQEVKEVRQEVKEVKPETPKGTNWETTPDMVDPDGVPVYSSPGKHPPAGVQFRIQSIKNPSPGVWLQASSGG